MVFYLEKGFGFRTPTRERSSKACMFIKYENLASTFIKLGALTGPVGRNTSLFGENCSKVWRQRAVRDFFGAEVKCCNVAVFDWSSNFWKLLSVQICYVWFPIRSSFFELNFKLTFDFVSPSSFVIWKLWHWFTTLRLRERTNCKSI